jgi:uncharacterized protein YegP (UPF0339 family)
MTRSTPLAQAVSGQTKHPAGAGAASERGSMQFLSFEDNGGAFHWALVAASGDHLVQSASFVSYEQAKQAAGVVRSGAVSAPFENRADDPAPLELGAHRPIPAPSADTLCACRVWDATACTSSPPTSGQRPCDGPRLSGVRSGPPGQEPTPHPQRSRTPTSRHPTSPSRGTPSIRKGRL